jgi:hypothetical protein
MVDVVRDDLLFAGTKQRAASKFVQQLIAVRKAATTELLYTAPYNGFGPVAVAHCAQCLGLKCTLILTRRAICSSRSVPLAVCQNAETVRRAAACGATIHFADTWDEMRAKGFEIYNADHGVLWVPVGLSGPGFIDVLCEKVREAAESLACKEKWKRLFVAGGTGALGVAIARALPQVHVCIVPASIDPEGRKRIERTVGEDLLKYRITIMAAHSETPAKGSPVPPPPPYPTVPGYDELTWLMAARDPREGDVVWNVAGFDGTHKRTREMEPDHS